MITDSRAYRYARQCADDTSGRVGKYVKLQCREWLDIADGKSDIAEVSEQEYKRLCGILQIMVHPDLLTDMFHAIEDYAMFSSWRYSAQSAVMMTADYTQPHCWR